MVTTRKPAPDFVPRQRVRLLVSCLAWVHRAKERGEFAPRTMPNDRRFLSTTEPLLYHGPGEKPGTCLLRDRWNVLYIVPVSFLEEPA